MPTPAQQRKSVRRLAEADRITEAAMQLRHLAIQGEYAGFRGKYTGFALATMMGTIARDHHIHFGTVLWADTLRAAGYILDGPDGEHDPRTTRSEGLGSY